MNDILNTLGDIQRRLRRLETLGERPTNSTLDGSGTAGQVVTWVTATTLGSAGYAGSAVTRYTGVPTAGRVATWAGNGTVQDAGFAGSVVTLYTGTPVAGRIASWTGAGTLQASTPASLALTQYTGTGTAGNLVAWASNGTVQDAGVTTAQFVTTNAANTFTALQTAQLADATTLYSVGSVTSMLALRNSVNQSNTTAGVQFRVGNSSNTEQQAYVGFVSVGGTPSPKFIVRISTGTASYAEYLSIAPGGLTTVNALTVSGLAAVGTDSNIVTVDDTSLAALRVVTAQPFPLSLDGSGPYAGLDINGVGTASVPFIQLNRGTARGLSITMQTDNDTINFRNGNALGAAMLTFVKSAGYVGVNTTTPVSNLDVAASTGGVLTLKRVDTSVTADSVIGKIQFYAKDTSTITNQIAAEIEAQATNTISADNNPGRLIFRTTRANIAATPTERMRITQDGYLELQAGNSTGVEARVGGLMYKAYTSAGNVGTGDDTLHSYSVPANTLEVNGDTLHFEAYGSFADSNNTKRVRAYFGATLIADSGASVAANTDWHLTGLVVRTGAATQQASSDYRDDAGRDGILPVATPAETLSNAITLKVTGETNVAVNNEVVCTFFRVWWEPNNT